MKTLKLMTGFASLLLLAACGGKQAGDLEKAAERHPQPVRIVCVGNSITEGIGASCAEMAWPAQLNRLLGDEYEVLNCGVSGTSMLKRSNYPFWSTARYTRARNADPQILIISLGTNDAAPRRWKDLHGDYKADYLSMIAEFRKNGRDPIIYLGLTPPLFGLGKKEHNRIVEEEVIPIIKEVAEETGAYLIDFHTPALEAADKFPDDTHPNDEGAALLAQIACGKIKEMQTIRPRFAVDGGETTEGSVAMVKRGGTVTFDPQPETGSWTWTGAGGFRSQERTVRIENVQRGGVYTVVRTDENGRRSVANFLLSIEGEEGTPLATRFKAEGEWAEGDSVSIHPGLDLTLRVETGDEKKLSCRWYAPDGTLLTVEPQIELKTIVASQAGRYTVSCTDSLGRQSSRSVTVAVEGELRCPDAVSYIYYGDWKQTAEMEVKAGEQVKLGPQPVGGNWHWEGPNGFASNLREVSISDFDESKAGEYVGTFTNAAGCRSEVTVTLKLKK